MSMRRIIFWSHLVAGLAAGTFVLIMSVTGVLLTYENQVELAITDTVKVISPDGGLQMSVEELSQLENVQSAGDRGISLTFDNRENAPVGVRAGRSGGFLLNPYTGEELTDPAEGWSAVYRQIMFIHRWLGAEGESRDTARMITGAANLVFLFLLISGAYIWLPKAWKWVFFRLNMFFRKSYPTSKARDFNWHHVFAFWAFVPLFFIVISGVMISYPWAVDLINAAWGEEGGRRGPETANDTNAEAAEMPAGDLASLDEAIAAAQTYGDKEWTRISLSLPESQTATDLTLTRHFGDRVLPQQRETLTFDRITGEITDVQTYADNSPARKTRLFLRFIHTGERYGLIGSTIAGLSSLAACFLVYTGFALSFRRLILPLFRKKPARKNA
tara:strand:- start:13762 stop:14922 length:1161 start_codon:yes stop_codon:yes gene_type:complete